MALILADRVQETCNSPGTGTVTLLGAQTGYQSFSAGVGNGNTTFYAIADQVGANWEVGLGTYSSTGNTLARTTVLASSNAGSLVNFASGIQNVWVDYPAGKSVNLDASGYVDAGGNPYLTFSPQSSNPTAATGLIWYDQNKDSLSYYNATGYEINIGQQVDQVCYNNTGSTIPAGTAVYLSGGSSGNYPYITPAIATSQSTANMVGITGQSIANGSTGIVVILGEIFSYNTTGMTAGQTLYLSPTTAGALTTIQPASPFYAVRAGFVVVGGSSTGIIFASVRNVYTLGSNIISPVSFTAFSTSSNVLQLYGYSSSQIADLIDIWTYSGGTKAFAINNAGAIYAGTWNGSTIGTAYGGTGLTALGAGVQTALGNAVSGSGNFALTTSPTLVTPILGTPQSGNFSTGTFTWPTFNQNTTGQAGSVANSHSAGTGLSGSSFNGSAAVSWTLATAYGDSINPYASKTANYVLAAPNGSAGVPTFRALVASDVPSLSYVNSVSATSPVASSGGLTPTISLNSAYGDTLNPYGSKTANYFLAAPNGSAGAPSFRAIVAADIPTINQNTTGQAGSVANSVTFNNGGAGAASGTTFNGSAAQTISYNTIGAPSTTGTNASGTWAISISGNAGTASVAGAVNGFLATGVTATTAATGTNSTVVATTAYAINQDIGGPSQSWTNVTSSRAPNALYTNSTGRPILVIVSATAAASSGQCYFQVNSVTVAYSSVSSASTNIPISVIVPAGATYYFGYVNVTGAINIWFELR